MGILLLLWGIATSWILAAVGLALAVICAVIWIRAAAADGDLLSTGEVEAVDPEPEPPRRTAREQDEHPAPPETTADRYPRSAFLAVTTLGLSQVVGILATVPALGFMVLPPFLKQGFEDHDVGPIADFPEGEWIVTTFTADERQGFVSRLTAFIRNNGFLGDQPSFTIISNHCAHLGCPVQPTAVLNPKPKQVADVRYIYLDTPPSGFVCPCHGGAYDTEGNRTAGPPVRSLDRYSFSIRHGRLFIGAPFSVSNVEGVGANAQIHKWTYAYPGEHVDGPQSWLYPIQPPH